MCFFGYVYANEAKINGTFGQTVSNCCTKAITHYLVLNTECCSIDYQCGFISPTHPVKYQQDSVLKPSDSCLCMKMDCGLNRLYI